MGEDGITSRKGSEVKSDKKYSSLAITGFVFSLLFFIPVFSIIGIICGIAGLVKISKDKTLKGKGLAISAIVIGAIVTLLQVLIVIAIYNFFMSFYGIVKDLSVYPPEQSVNECLKRGDGVGKDICIFLAIGVSMNQTESLDMDLCNKHISTTDMKHACNAILRKDSSYCENIMSSRARIKCYELFGKFSGISREMNRGEKNGTT